MTNLHELSACCPASFDFSTSSLPDRAWTCWCHSRSRRKRIGGDTLAVLGRLKPHVTVAQAQAEFEVINDQIRRAHPDRWTFGAKITALHTYLTGRFHRGLMVLLGAVGLVLLIGCTNLSNLMLSRAASRRKEMAIRSALGAGRARLIRQVLTESLVISLLGALAGLVLAYVSLKSISALQGFNIPLLHSVRIDGRLCCLRCWQRLRPRCCSVSSPHFKHREIGMPML